MVRFETRDLIFALVVLALIVDDSQQAQEALVVGGNDESPKLELAVKPLLVPEHFTKSGEIILNFVKPTWTTVYKIKTQRYFGHFAVTPDRNMNANLKLKLDNSSSGSIQKIDVNNDDWKRELESDGPQNEWSFEIPLKGDQVNTIRINGQRGAYAGKNHMDFTFDVSEIPARLEVDPKDSSKLIFVNGPKSNAYHWKISPNRDMTRGELNEFLPEQDNTSNIDFKFQKGIFYFGYYGEDNDNLIQTWEIQAGGADIIEQKEEDVNEDDDLRTMNDEQKSVSNDKQMQSTSGRKRNRAEFSRGADHNEPETLTFDINMRQSKNLKKQDSATPMTTTNDDASSGALSKINGQEHVETQRNVEVLPSLNIHSVSSDDNEDDDMTGNKQSTGTFQTQEATNIMEGNPEPSQQGHECQAASNINDDHFTVEDLYVDADEINRKEDNMNRNVDFDTLSNAQLYADGECSRSTENDALSRITTSNTLVSDTMNNELTVHEESIIEEIQTDKNIDDIVGDTVTIEVADVDNATRENNDVQEPVENSQERSNKDPDKNSGDEIEDTYDSAISATAVSVDQEVVHHDTKHAEQTNQSHGTNVGATIDIVDKKSKPRKSSFS
eukprot:79107_1